MTADPVNHPPHYQQVPDIECIDVIKHFSLLRGTAIKYLWRAGAKGDTITDLKKARWYIDNEIADLEDEAKYQAELVKELEGEKLH